MAGKVVKAIKWSLLSAVVSRLAPPVFIILLARLLAPEEFGLVAMAMVVIAFVTMFQDMGFRPALVQRREVGEELKNAVFWGTALFGVVFFLALYALAPAVGQMYRSQEVVPVLRTLAVLFLITPLGTVHGALLARELDFRRLFWIELIPAIVPGMVAITLALAGLGVWALVWGTLAGACVRVIGLWRAVAWRPGGGAHLREWPGLLRFGGWVSVESILGWVITHSDFLFAGRYLGAMQVGYYRLGVSLVLLPARTVGQSLGRVLFPAFSRVQKNMAQVRDGFERSFRLVALLVVPVGVAGVAYADPIVPLLLGEKWYPVVDVVQVLAPAGALAALVNVAPPLYRAIGRVKIMPRFLTVRAVVSIPVYWMAARQGLMDLVWAKLLLTLCFVPVNLGIAVRVLGSRAGAVIWPIAVTVGTAALAVGVGDIAGGLLTESALWWSFGVELLVFSVVYLGGVALLMPEARREVLGLVRSSLTGR